MVGPTYPHRGGIVHYTHALVAALAKRPDTSVELHSYSRLFPKLLYKGGAYEGTQAFAIEGVPVQRLLTYGDPFSWRRGAHAMRGPDVVHFQTWTPFLAPSMMGVARRVPGSRLVATVHNIVPHERAHRLLSPAARRLMRRMDAVIVHSPSLIEEAERELRVPRDRIHVVPHGPYDGFDRGRFTRAEARKRLGLAEDDVALLQFGIVRDYKGLDVAIEALALLPPRYKLVIAGECWEDWSRYQKLVEERGLASRVVARVVELQAMGFDWVALNATAISVAPLASDHSVTSRASSPSSVKSSRPSV